MIFEEVFWEKKRKKKTNPKYRLSKEFKTPDSLLKSWYEISIMVLKIAEEFDLKWQKRKRILNSFLLTMLIFRLVLAKNGQSYAHTIASLWDDHKTMGIDLPQEAPISASSFTEARKKLNPEIFKSINSHVTRASEECMEKDNIFKARLFAADGSKLNLPRPLLHHGYEVPMENAYYPQGILSVLYNLKSRSPYDFDLTKKKDERQSALGHLGHLEEGDIVIYDRGYYSYEMLHFHKLRKVDAIFRLPKSLGGEIDQFWDDPVSIDKIIEVFPSQSVMSKLSRRHPCSSFKPIRIRLVKYVVKEKEYVIGTTILDQNISIKKYSDTYHARWGVEELYKTTKTMLNAEFIRSKNENGVLQEIYANFALQSLTRIISNSADDQINHRKVALDCSKTPAVKVNFLNTIQTVQRKIAGLFALSRQTVRNTIEIVFGATSRVYQASRPGRSFPRISMRPTKRLKAV